MVRNEAAVEAGVQQNEGEQNHALLKREASKKTLGLGWLRDLNFMVQLWHELSPSYFTVS